MPYTLQDIGQCGCCPPAEDLTLTIFGGPSNVYTYTMVYVPGLYWIVGCGPKDGLWIQAVLECSTSTGPAMYINFFSGTPCNAGNQVDGCGGLPLLNYFVSPLLIDFSANACLLAQGIISLAITL